MKCFAQRIMKTAICGAFGLFIGLSSVMAETFSPPELLQRGIRAQETKHDLDEAITSYEQILSHTNVAGAVAAEAQYRLGVCYYAKKQYAKATKAFKTVIEEFSDQGPTVQLAKQFMESTVTFLSPPWSDRERMTLEIKIPNGTRVGVLMYSTHASEENGRKVWKLDSRMFGPVESFARVDADAASFKPLHSRWKQTILGDAEAKYSSNTVNISYININGKDTKVIDVPPSVFDNDQLAQLLRRLPLETNYSVTVSAVSSYSKVPLIPVTIDVPKTETLRVAAGQFECFRVDVSLHQTFWISADSHRYIVKFQTGTAQAELISVDDVNPAEPVTYRNKETGFSVTAPPGWYFFEAAENDAIARVYLLDPEATARAWMVIKNRETLASGFGGSLRAWAQSALFDSDTEMKDIYPRKDTWRELNLPGAHALTVLCDINENRKAKVSYQLVADAGTNTFQFTCHVPTEDFKSMEPKIQGIINSLKFH